MLGPRVPELRALELLLVVARTGSLGAAAAELGVSQQAASSRVRTMESLIGAPLFARTRRGSALTSTGELVVQWASRVLDAAEQLDAGITALRSDRRGALAVAASLTIAEYLLPSWLVALRAHQQARGAEPIEITMTALNSERVVALVTEGKVDVGFVEGPHPPAGLSHMLLGVDELVVVVGPTHPWAGRRQRPITTAVLARTPLVTREAGSGTRTVLEQALRNYPMAAPALELSSTAAVKSAVMAGAGPAALSAHAVSDDIAAARLVAVSVRGLVLSRGLHAVWKGGAKPPAGPVRELLRLAMTAPF